MQIKNAELAAEMETLREKQVASSVQQIASRIETLRQKTAIVDKLFDDAKHDIKFNWRVIEHENYEIRMTPDEMIGRLRDEIEPEVVRILFEDTH